MQLSSPRSNFRILLILGALLLSLPLVALAQEATIVGTVTDASGSAIPGVTITITNTDTGLTRTSVTNDVGQYVAPSLRIGHYEIKAEIQGFKTAEQKGKSADQVAAERIATIPARRFGNPDEFGAACAFLCSTHGGYITGQNLLIDGGTFNGAF